MTQMIPRDDTAMAARIEEVLVQGNLAQLTPPERVDYYNRVCQSVGLNPFTRPFEYVTLNGKLTLYAKRDAADQLRKIHGINIQIVSQNLDKDTGLYTVHVRATDKSGRTDEDMGVVAVGKKIGDDLANGILKTITKAKRRVTLSIAGLGFLDETEVEDIPERDKKPAVAMPTRRVEAAVEPPPVAVDRETGEVIDPGSWTNHELSALLRGHDLKPSDLGAILGGGLTKDNLRERIDEWLADQPDMSLVDICQMAADVKREEETEPQAALI